MIMLGHWTNVKDGPKEIDSCWEGESSQACEIVERKEWLAQEI